MPPAVAVPTKEHARVGCHLLDAGVDVLVEKPMASSLEEADQLIASAQRSGRILQIGHVERFNPAVAAAEKIISRPMFFEVHRLGVFTPRSLDIDVVYDVMIHDLDILLALVDAPVVDLKAVGIPVITDKVDIAHARIEFQTGAVANVTASRVSTERVRKMRFFQEHEYISLDFVRQDALRIRVQPGSPQPGIGFDKLPATPEEPLRAELRAFLDSVRTRKPPVVDGAAGPPQSRACRPGDGRHPRTRWPRPIRSYHSTGNSMIPRTLVPVDVRPVSKDEAQETPHRLTTYMDDRTVVPSGLSDAPPLNGKTSIPEYLPLGVLVNRTLVPRGMPITPLERTQHVSSLPLDILDSRVVVPANVDPVTDDWTKEFEHAFEMTARSSRSDRAGSVYHRRCQSADRA